MPFTVFFRLHTLQYYSAFFFNVFIGIDEVYMRLLLLLQQRFIVIKLIMHICIGNHLNV